MRGTAHLRHPLAIGAEPASPVRRCRFCGHPIQVYEHVGWVDMTTPYLGGTYDMCEVETWVSHEPQPPPRARQVAPKPSNTHGPRTQ